MEGTLHAIAGLRHRARPRPLRHGEDSDPPGALDQPPMRRRRIGGAARARHAQSRAAHGKVIVRRGIPECEKPPEIRGFRSLEPVHRNSNKSALLPPPLVELQKLAGLASNPSVSNSPPTPSPRLLRRRLDPALIAEIVAKYQSGVTTPSLCVEYTLSKGGLLKVLRDEGVQLRCQPLDAEQVREAADLYGGGMSLAAIAAHFDVSYNGVRQVFVRAGVERRPRGGKRA